MAVKETSQKEEAGKLGSHNETPNWLTHDKEHPLGLAQVE